MHYKNEEAFSKAHKESGTRGAYLLFGAEEYLVDAWKNRLIKPFSGAGAFNLQRFEGRGLSGDLLLDAVEAVPLMAEEKCVLVEDIEPSKLPAKEQDKLLEAVGNLPEGCILVLTGKSAFDAKSAIGKKLIQAVAETGAVVELGARGEAGLVTFLKSAAKREGCELPTALAHRIIELVGEDMNTLHSELAKICARAGYGGAITREHIDAVASPRTEARAFDLSKAILARQGKRAMDILSDLFELRESPVGILSALTMSYVDLYRARLARDNGMTMPVFMERFGLKSEYRARAAYNGRLSTAALATALEALYTCDTRMKSTGIDDRVLLEQTVVRLMHC